MDCNELAEQLHEYLDEDARQELTEAIHEHLSRCPDCKVEVDTVKMTIVLYRADRQMATPLAVSERLQKMLQRAYEERQ